jgi:hypothetical protein
MLGQRNFFLVKINMKIWRIKNLLRFSCLSQPCQKQRDIQNGLMKTTEGWKSRDAVFLKVSEYNSCHVDKNVNVKSSIFTRAKT